MGNGKREIGSREIGKDGWENYLASSTDGPTKLVGTLGTQVLCPCYNPHCPGEWDGPNTLGS